MKARSLLFSIWATLACLAPVTVSAEGLVDSLVQRFGQSDFEFLRARSNVPFLPLAWLSTTGYEETRFRRLDGTNAEVTAKQWSVSQGAFIPIPWGQRDVIVVGEWLSWTRFDLENSTRSDFDVTSAAIPLGWIRQSSPDWQFAAFVAPLGHKTPGEDWYWETLGGVFARNMRHERFAWVVGAYFDVSPLEDFYTPYAGATYIINDRWTLNAIMPWPAVMYAPSMNTLFRLGVTPSGASWSVEPGERRPRMDLSSWNFGVSAERRIFGNIWLGVEIGVSGLRGLSIVGGDWESPETKLDNTGFALITLNLRPGTALERTTSEE